jgi:hypothetical protein
MDSSIGYPKTMLTSDADREEQNNQEFMLIQAPSRQE